VSMGPEAPSGFNYTQHNCNRPLRWGCGKRTLIGFVGGHDHHHRFRCKSYSYGRCGPRKVRQVRKRIVQLALKHRLRRFLIQARYAGAIEAVSTVMVDPGGAATVLSTSTSAHCPAPWIVSGCARHSGLVFRTPDYTTRLPAANHRAAASALSSGRVLKAIAAPGSALRIELMTTSNKARQRGGKRTPAPMTTQS
jgi:hypothetical protein